MKSFGRHVLAASAAAAIALAAGSARADVQAGITAWDKGDFAGAVREWRPLAEKGDPDAQFNLAQAYKQGKGVPEDPATALSWFQKAAEQGHPQAQVNTGLLLYNSGRKADAVPWLKKGADIGDPRSQYILGTEMFNGQIVPKDWPRAYALMSLSAGRGLTAAGNNLKAMDQYIPAAERQQGLEIAKRMQSGAEKLAGPSVRVAANNTAVVTQPPASYTPPPLAYAPPPSAYAPPPPPPSRAPGVSYGRPPVPDSSRAPAAPRHAQPTQVATRSPKPAAPKAAPAAASPGGRWRVQLGAFSDAGNAQRQWASVRGKPGLGGLHPYMVKAGAITRLQAGPLASREAAERVCAAAKAAGTGCIPVAP